MKKIKYNIHAWATKYGVVVEPIIEHSFGRSLNMVMLPVSEIESVKWIWCYSYVTTHEIEKEYQSLLELKREEFAFMCAVIRPNSGLDEQTIYNQIIHHLFCSFRCGIDFREMLIKVARQLSSADWRDFNIPQLVIESSHKRKWGCKIYPQYGTIASFLKVNELQGLPSVELTQWQPQAGTAYEIIWQLLIVLSDGAEYWMQLPICSRTIWYDRIQQYFDDNPTQLTSPVINCVVTTESYNYPIICNRLQRLSKDIIGSSPTEVLLKLSSYLHDAQQKNYLQKILSTGDVELKFSGEVIWKDHRPK